MISRRGFFGMLAGLATSPLFGRFLPQTYSTYLVGKDAVMSWEPNKAYKNGDRIAVTGVCEPIYFRCGTREMGTLYWSKENS